MTFILPELESQKLSGLDVEFLTYSDALGPQKVFDIFLEDKNFDRIGIVIYFKFKTSFFFNFSNGAFGITLIKFDMSFR